MIRPLSPSWVVLCCANACHTSTHISCHQTCQFLTDLGSSYLLHPPSSFYCLKWLTHLCHFCQNLNLTSSKRSSVVTLDKIVFHLHQFLHCFLQVFKNSWDYFVWSFLFLFMACFFHQTIALESKDFILAHFC